jgi:hypothetical protein
MPGCKLYMYAHAASRRSTHDWPLHGPVLLTPDPHTVVTSLNNGNTLTKL